jgi:glutamate synthase (NADPH/NADH) large chain
MTGGVAVILGEIGANFGAGMTGGMAYLYDPEGAAPRLMNMETLMTVPVTVPHWQAELYDLVRRHAEETGSRKAKTLLQDWDRELLHFVQVCPTEMLVHLPAPLSEEAGAIPAE